MSELKKVLLITPSFSIGGIERNMQLLSRALIKKGVEVEIAVLHDGYHYMEYPQQAKLIVPKKKRGNTFSSKFLYRLHLPFFIRKSIKILKPEAVLCFADTFNGMVVLASLGLGSKVIIGDITKPDRKFSASTRVLKRLFYPLSDGFIAQTQAAKTYYENKFSNRLNIKVLGPIIEGVECENDCKREEIILNVGRLSFEKGQDRIVEIFSKLKNKGNWKLYFTADGSLRPRIEGLIQEYGLEQKVFLLGFVENIKELYCKASIFVLPSRLEGYPNALVEAMSAKLPCVVFNSFPADEIIDNERNGFICKDGDMTDFGDKLIKLMEDQALREKLGTEACIKVDKFRSDVTVNDLIKFISEM